MSQSHRMSADAAPWYPRGQESRSEQPAQRSTPQPPDEQPQQLEPLQDLWDVPGSVFLTRDQAWTLFTRAVQDSEMDVDWTAMHQNANYHTSTGELVRVHYRGRLMNIEQILELLEDVVSESEDEDDGLTEHEMNQLHTYRFQPIATNDVQCSCCLADYEAGEILRVLPCNHEFHSACVEQWLTRNRTCPLCRTDAAPESDAPLV